MIVGGGSAGWIIANLLNAYLNAKVVPSDRIQISLIESPNIPTIGVGEATVPTIRDTLLRIGIGEKDFMRATDATFKSTIRFKDWNLGGEFDHPFDRRNRATTDDDLHAWLAEGRSGKDFAKQFSLLSNVCDHNLAPKGLNWPDYNSAFPYAYHLDAIKLAGLLTKHGLANGVQHHLATVDRVTLTETGEISEVLTATGEVHRADLFIDCTGFSARLISQLESEVCDYSSTLLCDRALTVQIPFDVHAPEKLRPYTLATARSAGWNWDISLQNRRGLGYVYSSAFLSEEEALEEIRGFEGSHVDELNVRSIKFKTYKRARSWVGNCLAIGLSDCFIEPLESSGLFMIEFAGHLLGETLRASRSIKPSTSQHYNRVMHGLAEEVLDYVSLHYLTSKRSDTEFWQNAANPNRATERLRDLLSEWRERPIRDTDVIYLNRLFSVESYEFLLFGMNYTQPSDKNSQAPFNYDISNELNRCLSTLPRHEDWLKRLNSNS